MIPTELLIIRLAELLNYGQFRITVVEPSMCTIRGIYYNFVGVKKKPDQFVYIEDMPAYVIRAYNNGDMVILCLNAMLSARFYAYEERIDPYENFKRDTFLNYVKGITNKDLIISKLKERLKL